MLGSLSFVTISVTVLSLSVWLIALVKDICVRKVKRVRGVRTIFCRVRHEPFMQNFVVRLAYQLYFELFLCALLSFASNQRTFSGDNLESVSTEIKADEGGTEFLEAIDLLCAILVIMALIILLLYTASFNWYIICFCCIGKRYKRRKVLHRASIPIM